MIDRPYNYYPELETLLPDHNCSLSLEHNQHKSYCEPIEQWEKHFRSCSGDSDPVTFGW